MTIKEKKKAVLRYCDTAICDTCLLADREWTHGLRGYTGKLCLDISEADEDEFDRALELINGTAPAACDDCNYCDYDEETEPCKSCKHNQLIGTEAYNNAPERYEPQDAPATPVIKDSGDRTEFITGAVRDMHTGKGRMDLLPWAAIMEVSKHCESGALKYGEHNVDKGIPTSSLCDSAARHLAKHIDGWTDEAHLVAAAWNLLWAIQMEIKHPELVDVPWREEGVIVEK